MSLVLLEAPPVASWYRLDVRCWNALARTRVRVLGTLDTAAVDEIDRAVLTAEWRQHELVLDLGQVSSVTPEAMRELMTRDRLPRVAIAG